MATVQIRDVCLWVPHIEGDRALAAKLTSLAPGETIVLEVDGFVGPWLKMRDGKDTRPTNGLRPVGPTVAFWAEAQTRRGEKVPIRLVSGNAAESAKAPETSTRLAASPSAYRADALRGGSLLNNYFVDEVLGSGGFGITYRATERFTDRRVAIKEYMPSNLATRRHDGTTVLPISSNAVDELRWGLERFRNEAKTLSGIRHENVVPVLGYFELNSTGYLIMEFEEGRSLRQIMRSGEEPTEGALYNLMWPLLAGVQAVHRHGFLHRDIKPENIYVRLDHSPVLLDFGAARNALSLHSHGFTAIITEGYAPHEQYERDGRQGPWTDIYALGALMYEYMAGERPAPAPNRVGAKVRGAPDPLALGLERLRSRVSPALIIAIDRALSVMEADRPQSIQDLRDLLWPSVPETIVLGRNTRPAETEKLGSDETLDLGGASPDHLEKQFGERPGGKYVPLYHFLRAKSEDEWMATFGDVERVLKFSLPMSARNHSAWWSNAAPGTGHPHSNSWTAAGWKTVQVDVWGRRIKFIRERRR